MISVLNEERRRTRASRALRERSELGEMRELFLGENYSDEVVLTNNARVTSVPARRRRRHGSGSSSPPKRCQSYSRTLALRPELLLSLEAMVKLSTLHSLLLLPSLVLSGSSPVANGSGNRKWDHGRERKKKQQRGGLVNLPNLSGSLVIGIPVAI